MKYKMKVVKLADIDATDRYRSDMGNIDELMASIEEKGLIQPLCVNEDLRLLAGGRRHLACSNLHLVDVPVLIRAGNDPIDAREIELMENIHRKEMTWQEQAKLIAAIDTMYKEKDPLWTGKKTAQLIDQNPMNVSRALRLASGLEALPDLNKCKTADEASKVIKKAEEQVIVDELARRAKVKAQEEQKTAKANGVDPVLLTVKRGDQDYIIGDAFVGMEKLIKQHKKFHLIECDPPFAVPMPGTNKEFYTQDIVSKLETDDFSDIPPKEFPAFLERLAKDTFALAEDNSWMIFWLAMDWYVDTCRILEEAGWDVNPTPAIWVKGSVRTNPYPHNLSKAYHAFLVCKKGKPFLMRERRSNVFTYPHDQNPTHPHPKSLALMDNLLDTFIPSGSKILSPFLGSGVTIRAAYPYGCECTGFEISDKYKNHFLVSLEEDTRKLLKRES